MELLPHLQIQEIQMMAVRLGLDPAALLAGIDPSFAAAFAGHGGVGPQMLIELSMMNRATELEDGSLPLRRWLENALLLSATRPESEVFRRALARL